ncbi:MAG TPA: divergent polysaccharide deacetylase family protein [Thermoanaerobaculia bacterium]|nr:divergent polysaccharide deacetylase family protein [Thermoanaerobaculia bacterium]
MPIRRHPRPRSASNGIPPRRRAGGGALLFLLGIAVGAGGGWLAEHGSSWRRLVAGLSSVAAAHRDPASLQDDGVAQAPPGASASRPRRRGGMRPDATASSTAAAGGVRRSGEGAALTGDTAGALAPGAATAPARGTAAGGPAAAGPPRIALVIDDLGRSLEDLERLRRLGVPITYAVLPFESQTPEVAAALRQRHEEILCHLPMEPASGGDPGPGALRAGMSREQLRESTLAAIAAVPGAVGVNNHMGSALSTDAASMSAILGVLAPRGLYFLDSRTSAHSVGFRVATELGVPAAERQVFLDDDPRPEAVASQFQRLLELARGRGNAIAIGHPHPATLATLAAEVPRAQAGGYRFVAVSALLERPPTPPPAGSAPGGR